MKNVIKWMVIICGGLFLLAALVLLIVPFFIDVNKFKPEIERRVFEATGRPFSINGEIDLSLFPWGGSFYYGLHDGKPGGIPGKGICQHRGF